MKIRCVVFASSRERNTPFLVNHLFTRFNRVILATASRLRSNSLSARGRHQWVKSAMVSDVIADRDDGVCDRNFVNVASPWLVRQKIVHRSLHNKLVRFHRASRFIRQSPLP